MEAGSPGKEYDPNGDYLVYGAGCQHEACGTQEGTYRCVIHIRLRHRELGRDAEDDTDKHGPENARQVGRPSKQTITHIEWPWFEVDVGVVPVQPFSGHAKGVGQVAYHAFGEKTRTE